MWLRQQRDASEGRVFAGLTLYRGRKTDMFWRPQASVEVQFTEWEGTTSGYMWLSWRHKSAMVELPNWYAVRRLRERLTA
jgi:hypothetical protein